MRFPLFVSLWLFAVGCVNLSKPENVNKCANLGNCSDDPNAQVGPDAKEDTLDPAGPDLPGGDDLVADAPSDLPTKSDAKESGSDRVGDKQSGPESGPDTLLAPDREPDLELAGPEPGPEFGPEPGPEPAPEPGPDGGADTSTTNCPVLSGKFDIGTTKAVCFVTCDAIQYGWSCWNGTQTRGVKINGVSVACNGSLSAIPRVHADGGSYYYFEIGAGGTVTDGLQWTGPVATSCPVPSGGFSPK